jgi:hypothetical protein
MDDASDYSIMRGCSVHPKAASIPRNGEVNCLKCHMWETSWSITRQSVTAIFVTVSHNTIIATAFSFGRMKDYDQYNIFSMSFLINLESHSIDSNENQIGHPALLCLPNCKYSSIRFASVISERLIKIASFLSLFAI